MRLGIVARPSGREALHARRCEESGAFGCIPKSAGIPALNGSPDSIGTG